MITPVASPLRLFPLAALALSAAACGHARPPPPEPQGSPTPFTYEPTPSYAPMAWISSIAEARARAAEEHKPMVLFVRAAWDKSSVMMDTTVWSDARVLREAPRFIALRVDVTDSYAKDKTLPAGLEEYGIDSVPTTIVMTSAGAMRGRFKAGTANAVDVARAMQDAH